MSFVKRTTLLVTIALASCCGCDSGGVPAELQRDIGTVTLEVDFGGQKRSKSIDVVCSPDSTVLMSLERARQLNQLSLEFSGSGETAFVHSIDGVRNEDGGGKSWTYRVNEKLGDKSAGVFALVPGDSVTWTFGSRPEDLDGGLRD